MDINTLRIPVETAAKSTKMLKPISEIATIVSNEYLKKVELNEYCKIVESDLSKFQNKVQALISAKNDSIRIKADYKSRNKINVTNSKSLRQALNELYKYKAEMKSCYIATEKSLKLKRIKYNKIISDYDSAWRETLKKYNANLVFVKLLEIQQNNSFLEKEIGRQEKLNASTETEFNQLKENIESAFYKKIVEFSKAVIQYEEFLKSQDQLKKDETLKTQNAERGFKFKLFKADVPPFGKNSFNFETSDDANIICSIDISVFDDIMVPSENLESQNLEDDGYSFIVSDGKQLSDVSKDQEEDLEYLNNYQQKMESKNKDLNHLKINPVQGSSKTEMIEENESQYFKQQALEAQHKNSQQLERQNFTEENFNKERNTIDGKFNNYDEETKKLNLVNSESAAVLHKMDSEDDIQIDCEEFIGERSYEKQFGSQKETYECQSLKASSVSSEDFPHGENQNESPGPSYKAFAEESSSCFKPKPKPEKSDFKSFPGFFMMENDHETLTPSIFKLF